MSKGTVEYTYRIDIKSFRDILRDKGDMQVTMAIGERMYQLHISATNKLIIFSENQIKLSTTECNYGGVRYWLVCPCCNERTTRLYIVNSHFRCRTCANINYRSQQRTKTDFNYYLPLMEKLAKEVDGDFEVSPAIADFPSKPETMKWKKYFKLHRQFWIYNSKRDRLWLKSLGR